MRASSQQDQSALVPCRPYQVKTAALCSRFQQLELFLGGNLTSRDLPLSSLSGISSQENRQGVEARPRRWRVFERRRRAFLCRCKQRRTLGTVFTCAEHRTSIGGYC